MKQTNDKWTEQFRQRMAGHTEPIPEGLWERLEKELPPAPAAQVVPLWKRWTAVAAAVAAVAVTSIGTLWLVGPNIQETARTLPTLVPETPDGALLTDEDTRAATATEVRTATAMASAGLPTNRLLRVFANGTDGGRRLVQTAAAVHSPEPTEVRLTESHEGETVCTATGPEPQEATHTPSRRPTDRERRAADRRQMEANRRQLALEMPRRKVWTIGVGTGNGWSGTSDQTYGLSTFSLPYQGNQGPQNAPASSSGTALLGNVISRYDKQAAYVRHQTPLTAGVSLTCRLSDRWSLESGLYYTLLSSDLKTSDWSAVEEKQKLHYIGIPLNVQRTVWDSRWLTLYATAGGMVEKCVSARLTTTYSAAQTPTGSSTSPRPAQSDRLEDKPWQFSVRAAAGVQLNATPSIGLYAEPGIAYYFDDGTDLQTLRKEHPCDFHLQVGLRFRLPH